MSRLKLFLLLQFMFLQSCSFLNLGIKEPGNCSDTKNELHQRYHLFKNLSAEEIKKRKNTKIPTVSALNELSVFSKMVSAVKKAKPNAKFIPVDLRYYKDVSLGEIMLSNSSQFFLKTFLKTSKYSQGYFAVMNFNHDKITIIPPEVKKVFETTEINRPDLAEAEIVINVSDAKHIGGNMKFSPEQHISIIADRISDPYRLDLRESSNLQTYLDQKWIMSVYSIENSTLDGGKKTTGFFRFVNNKNAKIYLDKFDNSDTQCYSDEYGTRLKIK